VLARRDLALAGLVLIPVGLVTMAMADSPVGSVVLVAGWLLAFGALVWAFRAPSERQPPLVPRGWGPPSFIMATSVAAVGVGAEEPLAGVGIAYVAVLWFCLRFWELIA
jgi:hypothetical protein